VRQLPSAEAAPAAEAVQPQPLRPRNDGAYRAGDVPVQPDVPLGLRVLRSDLQVPLLAGRVRWGTVTRVCGYLA
jgi:hypothetical protein